MHFFTLVFCCLSLCCCFSTTCSSVCINWISQTLLHTHAFTVKKQTKKKLLLCSKGKCQVKVNVSGKLENLIITAKLYSLFFCQWSCPLLAIRNKLVLIDLTFHNWRHLHFTSVMSIIKPLSGFLCSAFLHPAPVIPADQRVPNPGR